MYDVSLCAVSKQLLITGQFVHNSRLGFMKISLFFSPYVSSLYLNRLMSPLSKDETRRGSSVLHCLGNRIIHHCGVCVII